MNIVTITRTVAVALVLVLVLTATGLWAGAETEEASAAAADKRYVTDPVTGKVYTAHEYGGSLTFVKGNDGGWIDAYKENAVSMWALVYEKLGKLDWALDRDVYPFTGGYMTPLYALRGALAESWEQPDDTTIIINVRQGVHWHDKAPMNGREFTAEDVEHSFQRYLGLGRFAGDDPSPGGGELTSVPWESVEATGDHTVVFKLKEPRLRALNLILDWYQMLMQPPEVVDEHGGITDWRQGVGTGPYEMTDWVLGSSFEYTRNPNYWAFDEKWPENRLPYIEKIYGLVIVEHATRIAGLRSGAIDYIGHPGSAQIFDINQSLSLQRTHPEINQYPWSQRSDNCAGINTTVAPFDDVRVRRAMQMALDLDTMNDSYYKGLGGTIPRGFVGRKFPSYMTPFEDWSAELKGYYSYDPAGAEALLDEAGYPRGADGIRFKTEYMHFDRFPVSWSEFMVSYWRQIGVEIDILTPTQAEHTARRNAGDWALTSEACGTDADPMIIAPGFRSTVARSGVHDAQYDAWFETAVNASTIEEQQGLIKQMDMRYIEQHWMIWGPWAPQYNVAQSWIMGYNGEGIIGGNTTHSVFSRLWIDSQMKEAMGH